MHGDARLQMLNRSMADRLDRVIVGAPPLVVSSGAPGARDEVRAYAARIGSAWAAFMSQDAQPWAVAVGLVGSSGYPKEIEDEWGDYDKLAANVAAAAASPTVTKKQQATYYAKLRGDHYNFDAYRGQLASFDLTGPTPSEAWQQLQLHESVLHGDVALFEKFSGKPATAQPKKELEDPGGMKQSDPASTIKTVAIAAAVAAVAIGAAVVLK